MVNLSDVALWDRRLVMIFCGILCRRLIELREYDQAARTLQFAWKDKLLASQRRRRSALIIQSALNASKTSKHFRHLSQSVVMVQSALRAFASHQSALMNISTLTIQSCFAAVKPRYNFKSKQRSCSTIVAFDSTLRNVSSMKFVKNAVIVIQASIRSCWSEKSLQERKVSGVVVSAFFNAYRSKMNFERMRKASLAAQASLRGTMSHSGVAFTKQSMIVLQSALRSILFHTRFSRSQRHTVCLQAAFSSIHIRLAFLRLKNASSIAQSNISAFQASQQFEKLRSCSLSWQSCLSSIIAVKKIDEQFSKIKVIQSFFMASYLSRTIRRQTNSAVVLQSSLHSYLSKRSFLEKLESVTVFHTFVKTWIARGSMRFYTQRCHQVQSFFKTFLARKQFILRKSSSTVISSFAFSLKNALKVQELKKCTETAQTLRSLVFRRKQKELGRSARISSSFLRSSLERIKFKKTQSACNSLQPSIRSRIAYSRTRKLVLAIKSVQGSLKAFLELRKHHRLSQDSVKIQSFLQSAIESMRMTEKLSLQLQSVLTVQTFLHSHLHAIRYQRLRFDVQVVQAFFQSYSSFKGFHFVQKATRDVQLLKDVIDQHISTRNMIMQRKISTFVCIATLQAIQSSNAHLRVKNAVLSSQAFMRSYSYTAQTLGIFKGARVCQSFLKSHIQRKGMEYVRERSVAIQSLCFAILEARRTAQICSASTIAIAFFSQKLQVSKVDTLKKLSTVVQSGANAFISSRRTGLSIYERKQAAEIVHSSIMTWVNQKQLYLTRDKTMAIQALFRSLSLSAALRTRIVATTISQSLLFSLMDSFHCASNLKSQRKAAILLQKQWRHYCKVKSSRVVQSLLRSLSNRLHFRVCSNSAKSIQTLLFSLTCSSRAAMHLEHQNQAAVVLQRKWRHYCSVRASRVVQAFMRSRCKSIAFSVDRNHTEIIISAIRSVQDAKRSAQQIRQCHSAAISIQRFWRNHRVTQAAKIIQAGAIAASFVNMHNCLKIQVQSIQAGFHALRDCQELKNEIVVTKAATTKIQRAWRLFVLKRQSCVIQSCFRGFQTRQRLKLWQNSSNAILSGLGAIRDSRRIGRILQLHHVASSRIQRKFRAYRLKKCTGIVQSFAKCRLSLRGFAVLKTAASTISSYNKMILMVRRVKTELDQMHFAASIIQRAFRAKRLRTASTTVQSYFSALKLANQVSQLRSNSLCIQSALKSYNESITCRRNLAAKMLVVGMFQTKWRYLRLKRSVQLCQSMMTSYNSSNRLIELKNGTHTIQSLFASMVNFIQIKKEFKHRNMTARKIQTTWFIYKFGSYHDLRLQSRIKIQAWARAVSVRREVKVYLDHIRCIQSLFRGFLLRMDREFALYCIIRVQAQVRGFLTRHRSSSAVKRARQRIADATARWSPQRTVSYRLAYCLKVISHNGQNLTQQVQALKELGNLFLLLIVHP
jgi:hypothetical protein